MIKGGVCWGFLFVCFCVIVVFFLSVLGIGHPHFFIIYLCLCVSVYMHVVPSEVSKGTGSPGAGVRGGYDVLDVVARNLTVALWRSSARSELWNHIFILRPRIFHVRQALH